MTEWILKYWLEVFFAAAVGGLTWVVKCEYKRQTAVEKGIEALLRDRIVQAYYHYVERGDITLHGLEAVESMYREYHNLGGNGAVTKLMEDLRKMKVVDN